LNATSLGFSLLVHSCLFYFLICETLDIQALFPSCWILLPSPPLAALCTEHLLPIDWTSDQRGPADIRKPLRSRLGLSDLPCSQPRIHSIQCLIDGMAPSIRSSKDRDSDNASKPRKLFFPLHVNRMPPMEPLLDPWILVNLLSDSGLAAPTCHVTLTLERANLHQTSKESTQQESLDSPTKGRTETRW